MASANVSQRPDGKWRARFRDPQGKEHAKHFRTKALAKKWLDEQRAAIVTGQFVDPSAGRETFRDYAERWRVAQVHRPSTADYHETMLRRHVYPRLGDRQLGAVLPSDIQAWVKGMSEDLAPSTVGVVHGIVAGIFRAAIRDRRIVANPCEGTRLPKAHKARVTPLDTSQVLSVADHVPDRYKALVTLAAGTGMRQGKCFGLQTDRIDFLRRTLTVDQQLVTVAKRDPFLAPPKTAASVRDIPLPAVVVEALAAHLVAFPSDGFVFTTERGFPIRRTHFSARVWRPAVAASTAPAGTTFHGLRHYYASLLIHHGESVKVVQDRLGHATAAETLETYAHLFPASDDRTRSAVDSVLGADYLRTTEAHR